MNDISLIDTHCHLDVLEQAPVQEILERARKAFVRRAITIGAGNGYTSPERAVELAEAYPNVFAVVGIHPQEAGKFEDLERLRPLLLHPKVVALGETGLDFYRDWAPEDKQREVFERSIILAKEIGKPIVIHCRDVTGSNRAADSILQTLRNLHAEEVGGVFHCYPMDAEFAAKLREINFLVSFPGVLTFKSAHALRETAKKIPLEQIMLETDAPYMAPEPYRGKPSEPAHVLAIAEKLAEVKGLRLEEIARQTSFNAERLFRLPVIH